MKTKPLFHQPLTAEQLQHLRELRADKPQPIKSSLPESLMDAFLDDPLFVGLLIFLNTTAFFALSYLILK
jgi:hypothetical protein